MKSKALITSALVILLAGVAVLKTSFSSAKKEVGVKKPALTFTLPEMVEMTRLESKLEELKYPGAKVVRATEEEIELVSEGSVEAITGWYKERINEREMKIRNYIQTSANENVVSQLVGISDEQKLKVELSREAGETEVRVLIKLTQQGVEP